MNINIPDAAYAEFWEDHGAEAEFWGLRWKPQKAKVGDPITFHYQKKPVAAAVIHAIEPPGQSACDHSGQFRSVWKIVWLTDTFVDLRTPPSELR